MVSRRDTNKALRWDSGTRKPEPASAALHGPDYAMSYACLDCKTAHKRHVEGSPVEYPKRMPCPICKNEMFRVGRNFKPPKKSDARQWEKVNFLISHGFLFQKIYDEGLNGMSVPYPDTLEEARDFVVKYAEYALRDF